MRIGQGYDAHCFQEGRPLILGGVEIPHTKGLVGHSDADVVIHALCDAILGAAGLGDIGQYFPSSDQTLKNISSRKILRQILELIANHGFHIKNADITIVAEEPKITPYREKMRSHLAEDLHIQQGCINIKATTTEGMGFTGRKEGIAAFAIVLLEEK